MCRSARLDVKYSSERTLPSLNRAPDSTLNLLLNRINCAVLAANMQALGTWAYQLPSDQPLMIVHVLLKLALTAIPAPRLLFAPIMHRNRLLSLNILLLALVTFILLFLPPGLHVFGEVMWSCGGAREMDMHHCACGVERTGITGIYEPTLCY